MLVHSYPSNTTLLAWPRPKLNLTNKLDSPVIYGKPNMLVLIECEKS